MFKVNWDSIKAYMLALFNQMFLGGRIMEQQKNGIVVCIPKTDTPTTPAVYRHNILLNTDYKILARIIDNRLRPTLFEVLHPSQYCGTPGNTIFDAVATVRDAIAYADLTHAPLCILFWTSQKNLTKSRIHISDVKELWIYHAFHHTHISNV